MLIVKTQIGLWALILVSFVCFTFANEKVIDPAKELPENCEDVFQNVPRMMSIGYGGYISSISWVKFIFTLSEALFTDPKQSKCLSVDLDRVIRFDSLWQYPYEMGGLVYFDSDSSHVRLAKKYLVSGIRNFPTYWKFRVYYSEILRDEGASSDTLYNVLKPLTVENGNVPEYARLMAFTVLERAHGSQRSMSQVLRIYEQISDPLIRFQFQNKIADLLRRNAVDLGNSDSAAFFHAISGMLDSKDASQIGMAKDILVRLVEPDHKEIALADAHQLAQQFEAYQQAAVGR